jgi:nucleoside-diphosphate-sugar epimerase
MNIGVLGATSEIAKDLITLLLNEKDKCLHLFARRPEEVKRWINVTAESKQYFIYDIDTFGSQDLDVVINFIGAGNPSKIIEIGYSIFDLTTHFDELVLKFLIKNKKCRYIFLSSGAVYGSIFSQPVNKKSKALIDINNLQPTDWYAISKLYAESRHRSLSHLPIVDLRIFNYFSHTQNLNSKFLIMDIINSIKNKTTLKITQTNIVRDYIGSRDFKNLISCILNSESVNRSFDCYSKSPIGIIELVDDMKRNFGLKYEISKDYKVANPTGLKINYYSLRNYQNDIGYEPSLSSIDLIREEVVKVIS